MHHEGEVVLQLLEKDRPARCRGGPPRPPRPRRPGPRGGRPRGRPRTRRRRFVPGERVGVTWLACDLRGLPFLPSRSEASARPRPSRAAARDGGYAEAVVADERFVYRLPADLADDQAAPSFAPASSATGRCGRPGSGPGGAWASTASVARPTSPRRSRWPRGGAVRGYPLRGGSEARLGARGGLGGRRSRPAAGPAGRGDPLRSGGRARAGLPGGPRPGRDARHRRDPPERRAAAQLRRPPVRGALGAQRDGQHPCRRRGAAAARTTVGGRRRRQPLPVRAGRRRPGRPRPRPAGRRSRARGWGPWLTNSDGVACTRDGFGVRALGQDEASRPRTCPWPARRRSSCSRQ